MNGTFVRLPPHVKEVLRTLAGRARVPESEIVRWAILTFAEGVDLNAGFGYFDLFFESSRMKGENRG